MTSSLTPQQAWDELVAGNRRFVEGETKHPRQGIEQRHILTAGQTPGAVFFGCGDSRVAAELIFDQGLGDLFVVRTAGHVTDPAVLGSIEFGVGVLGIPLIVVLGHDSCGAIKATLEAERSGVMPPGFLRDIVERVMPSILSGQRAGMRTADEFETEHVRNTTRLLSERSVVVHEKLQSGELAIIGAQYHLSDGDAQVVMSIGQVTV